MRSVALIVAGLAWAMAGAALAGPDTGGAAAGAKRPDINLPLEGVVTNPDWIEKPNGDDFATYFPPVAQMLGLEGWTVMQCQVSTTGTLEACTITAEKPHGLGFGDAALKISQFFRMKPMSVDGAPVAGGKINIPIRFQEPAPPADEVAGQPAADSGQPSPQALALARRVAATSLGPRRMQALADTARKFIGQRFAGVSLTEQQQAALDDYVQAIAASGAAQAEATARRYARKFTEQQLTEIAAFLESPAGQAWTERGVDDVADASEDSARVTKAISEDARTRFCSKYDCLEAAAAPAEPAAK